MGASRRGADADGANVNSFKNLEFWKLARTLAVDVVKLARTFPRDDATRVITRQFVASATSIRANIAEGHGRYSKAAYRNYLSIARGSATETENWVDLIAALDMISPQQERQFTARCQQIIAALTRIMRKLDADIRSAKAPRLADDSPVYGPAAERDFGEPIDDFDEHAPMPNAQLLSEEPE